MGELMFFVSPSKCAYDLRVELGQFDLRLGFF